MEHFMNSEKILLARVEVSCLMGLKFKAPLNHEDVLTVLVSAEVQQKNRDQEGVNQKNSDAKEYAAT